MEKLIFFLSITVILLIVGTSTITVNAFDLQSHYEKMKAKREQAEKEMTEKWLDDLEADGNLTPEAIKAAGKYGEGRVPNHKSKSESRNGKTSEGTGSSYTGTGKGWVYSADELHVIGLPEGENGYTKPGWYGDID